MDTLSRSWWWRDTLAIAGRDLLHWRRQPTPFLVGLLFPVLIVLMFGYLFGGAISVPGGGSYREFLLPGVFVMAMVFGVEVTMAAVSTDVAKGVTQRFRSLPMADAAVVLGRGAVDLLNAVLGLVVLLAAGLAVGWRAHGSMAGTLAALGLLLALRFALIWVGVYLGLVVSGPESVVAVQILVWPLGFLSSAYVPTGTMPGWLGLVAEWNPVSATVSAVRELFGNPGAGAAAGGWATDHALLLAVAWPVLITAVFLPLSVRRWRHADR